MISFITLALSTVAYGADVQADSAGYRIVALDVERLPSLNIPRSGHVTLCLDGVLTVFGGHTDGFTPTATAEYLSDDGWQTVPLAYPHDHGVGLLLRSGKVFLAGGHSEPLGIGQLFSAELYDPATHTTRGFGCMDRKRAFFNAVEMADNQVVISGNWFADDGIEMFVDVSDSRCTNATDIKKASANRSTPYILRISDDNAIIFSSLDNKAEPTDCSIVDQLKGNSYREPFLGEWRALHTIEVRRSSSQFIGNAAEGRYEWLLPVERNDTCGVAIARVKGPETGDSIASFSLLATEQPLPLSIRGKEVIYSSLLCDTIRHRAYLVGHHDDGSIIVVRFLYNLSTPAPLTVFITEPQPIKAGHSSPVLDIMGDIVFAGGYSDSNFCPSDAVFRLRVLQSVPAEAPILAEIPSRVPWMWIVIACLLAGCIAAAFILWHKRARDEEPADEERVIDSQQVGMHLGASADSAPEVTDEPLDKNMPKDDMLAELFKRIEQLMEEEKPYLNADLRISDVATRMGSNTTYVSAAINSLRGCSFSQYLINYRITYAQKLMHENPDRKISEVSALSGFSADSTFFRAFRAGTGMTPKKWLAAEKARRQP